jgi:hypothetical protein
MAWLEDNPELAAQYMEAACSGGDLFSIAMCVELATKTGSADLAEYYTRLGRSIYADFDSQFAVFKTDRWQSILLDRKPEPDK